MGSQQLLATSGQAQLAYDVTGATDKSPGRWKTRS